MSAKARILIVEDESIVALELQKRLERMGYAVAAIANTGEQAISLALELEPDLLLMDIGLRGGMDGIEAAQRIRAHRNVPVVYLTAYSDGATLDRAKATQPLAYLVKPFEEPMLRASIDVALDRHELDERRRAAENALRRSEERYRTLARAVPVGLFRTNEHGKTEYMNSRASTLAGLSAELGLQGERNGTIHPDDRQRVFRSWQQSQDNLVPFREEYRFVHHDGKVSWILGQAEPMDNGFVGSVTDITELKEAEAARAQTEAIYAGILETSHDAIISVGENHEILVFNRAAEELFGYRAEEVLGRPLELLIPAESTTIHRQHVDRFYKEGPPSQPMHRRSEIYGQKQNGDLFPAAASISRLELDDRRILTAIVRDLSEHRQLEEQLRHSQKMEAIGRLAGGVAHDFNNILTGIMGCAEILRRDLESESPQSRFVDEILTSSERAASLTHQLLLFSRRQVSKPEVVDPREVLAGMEKMISRLIGEDIELTVRLAEAVDPVEIDRSHLEQVVLNLSVNARDSMPAGGTLAIAVEARDVSHKDTVSLVPGRYTALTVQDSGCGMDDDIQTRIFEPFYTTKPAGRGTGLGLSTVFGIVDQAGGGILVESRPGSGSRFTVLLPVSDHYPTTESASAQKLPALETGGETILLVEDEEIVRSVVSNILQQAGYRVLTAHSGVEALETVASHPEPIDLLITDVVMPHTSGPELAAELRRLKPAVKVLLMTAHIPDSGTQSLLERYPVLRKPFSPEKLTRTVRQVLQALDDPTSTVDSGDLT